MIYALCFLFALVIGRWIYRAWLRHEDNKQERKQLEHLIYQQRLMAAHRVPRPMSEKASQGFSRGGGTAA